MELEQTNQTATNDAQPVQETPEAKIKAMEVERAALLQELENTKKGLSTAHSKLTEKDRMLKSIDYAPQLTEVNNKIAMLAALIAEQNGRTADEYSEAMNKKPVDLMAKFKALEAETKTKQAVARAQARVNEYKDKIEALGLTENDDDYLEIKDYVERGKFDIADRRLAKLVPKSATPKTPPKETEDERINRLAEEKARKILEEKGILKPERATPSGSLSNKDFLDGYSSGKFNSPADHKRAREILKEL